MRFKRKLYGLMSVVMLFGCMPQTVLAEDTAAAAETECLLDVNFTENADGSDTKGHTMTQYGEPEYGNGFAAFNGTDSAIRYDMTSEDYAKMADAFSVELYYMPLDTKNNNPLGNTQSSGFCFEQKSGTNTLQFWANINGSYTTPEANVEQDKWNYVVGTFDGENVNIYLNGELQQSKAASGTLTEPPHYLFLGGDTTSSGELEYQANCKVALARVYAGALDAETISSNYASLPVMEDDTETETKTAWEKATEEVKARFFIGSDVHISNTNAASKFEHVLDSFADIDENAAVLLVGDLTNYGLQSEYDSLNEVINNSAMADKTVFSMGNHEFYGGTQERFEENLGQPANEILYYSSTGVSSETMPDDLAATVVVISASDYNGDYTAQYDLLKEALETSNAKNPNAPIIIMGHHGIQDTAYVTNEWYGYYGEGSENDMTALMEQYPQVIHISGHSHATSEDARSIWQEKGYTAIQDGTLSSYFENESGKINPSSGEYSTYPEDYTIATQGLRLDVLDDGTVKIYRMNFLNDEYMYEDEPWVFNVSSQDKPYTLQARTEQSVAPHFSSDAQVTAEASGTSAVVTFPRAEENSNANVDMIHEYKITLTNTQTNEESVYRIFGDYYLAEKKDNFNVTIKGLDAETEYSIEVCAVTSFDKESEAIKLDGTITTGEGYTAVYPPETLLDVDFSVNPDGTDANGHTLTVVGTPEFEVDETLGYTVAGFDGSTNGLRYDMTDDDYAQLKKNFTVELYYMPRDTKNNDPLGNTQSSGFCFEQKSGTNTLQFWAHIGGSYITPEADVTQDAWNHVVGTYDGENVKIYLNGELVDSVAASGELKEPPHWLFLGGDTSSSGNIEYQANCKIALARVYTGTMTADDVQAAYEDVLSKSKNTNSYMWGDFNNNSELAADDAAAVLQYVLNNSYKPEEDELINYLDVTADGEINAADAAAILQKVLNNSYIFNAEM